MNQSKDTIEMPTLSQSLSVTVNLRCNLVFIHEYMSYPQKSDSYETLVRKLLGLSGNNFISSWSSFYGDNGGGLGLMKLLLSFTQSDEDEELGIWYPACWNIFTGGKLHTRPSTYILWGQTSLLDCSDQEYNCYGQEKLHFQC